jgi:hypothetical protein
MRRRRTACRRCRTREELMTLVVHLENAAHDVVPAAAQYSADWQPEGDVDRWCVAERLLVLQADLQRLRPLLEAVLGEQLPEPRVIVAGADF